MQYRPTSKFQTSIFGRSKSNFLGSMMFLTYLTIKWFEKEITHVRSSIYMNSLLLKIHSDANINSKHLYIISNNHCMLTLHGSVLLFQNCLQPSLPIIITCTLLLLLLLLYLISSNVTCTMVFSPSKIGWKLLIYVTQRLCLSSDTSLSWGTKFVYL